MLDTNNCIGTINERPAVGRRKLDALRCSLAMPVFAQVRACAEAKDLELGGPATPSCSDTPSAQWFSRAWLIVYFGISIVTS